MRKVDGEALYQDMRKARKPFIEEIHCPMILNVMADPRKGRVSAFCVEAVISDFTFYKWLKTSEIFLECYALGKLIAREIWEDEGYAISEQDTMPGTINYKFDHWKMIGWSRFGVGKNPRIRLDLNPKDSPNEHYKQLLEQAAQGEFTAGEIKQLMEAINVGLNSHQVFELQKEIDQLKSHLETMGENSNGQHKITNKGTA